MTCRCICHEGKLFYGHGEFCCPYAVHIPKPEKPGPGEHEPSVETVRARGFRATCACGWHTDPMQRPDAEEEADLHRIKTQPRRSIWG